MDEYEKAASTAMWGGPMTGEQAVIKLAKAACALDRVAHWTAEDDAVFGNPHTFASAALEAIGCNAEAGRMFWIQNPEP